MTSSRHWDRLPYDAEVVYAGKDVVHAARASVVGWNTACQKFVSPYVGGPNYGSRVMADVTCRACQHYLGAQE